MVTAASVLFGSAPFFITSPFFLACQLGQAFLFFLAFGLSLSLFLAGRGLLALGVFRHVVEVEVIEIVQVVEAERILAGIVLGLDLAAVAVPLHPLRVLAGLDFLLVVEVEVLVVPKIEVLVEGSGTRGVVAPLNFGLLACQQLDDEGRDSFEQCIRAAFDLVFDLANFRPLLDVPELDSEAVSGLPQLVDVAGYDSVVAVVLTKGLDAGGFLAAVFADLVFGGREDKPEASADVDFAGDQGCDVACSSVVDSPS